MKCPKCGGEIPFYNLKPNCMHCGVNIMYFTQETELARDAKRTELESAVARMVVARIKATFIGGKLQIVRMIAVLAAIAVLLVPFGGVRFTVPFFEGGFSLGAIGVYQAFSNGLLMQVPNLLGSTLLKTYTVAALVNAVFLIGALLCALIMLVTYLLSFLDMNRGTKAIRRTALASAIIGCLGQIASLILTFAVKDTGYAQVTVGFGGLAVFAVFMVLFFVNRALEKKGIEPVYRENDLKRKALLKQVRAGEVDLDSLPLPIFENEEEHEERMRALQEALKAEEENKEL